MATQYTQSPYGLKQTKTSSNNYKYTKGFEYSLDGENYIGEYHMVGQTAMTEPIESTTSKALTKYYSDPNLYEYDKARNFPKRVRIQPNQIVWSPIQSEYKNGYATRYFVERIGNMEGYPIEIDSNQASVYGKDNGIDEGVYVLVKIKWKLTGPERTMMYNGQMIEGIYEYNEHEVISKTRMIPNLEAAIKSYTEYAQITLAPSEVGPTKVSPITSTQVARRPNMSDLIKR